MPTVPPRAPAAQQHRSPDSPHRAQLEALTVVDLKEMLRNIVAIGNDLIFRSAIASPTLCVEGMTVAGE